MSEPIRLKWKDAASPHLVIEHIAQRSSSGGRSFVSRPCAFDRCMAHRRTVAERAMKAAGKTQDAERMKAERDSKRESCDRLKYRHRLAIDSEWRYCDSFDYCAYKLEAVRPSVPLHYRAGDCETWGEPVRFAADGKTNLIRALWDAQVEAAKDEGGIIAATANALTGSSWEVVDALAVGILTHSELKAVREYVAAEFAADEQRAAMSAVLQNARREAAQLALARYVAAGADAQLKPKDNRERLEARIGRG